MCIRDRLTTLIGYLDAAHRGIVTGKDKDDYIETARRKAHDLKEYIDCLLYTSDIDFVDFQLLFFLLFLVFLFSNLNHIGSSFLIV